MSSTSRTTIAAMLLAGDVGGTKTLVGLFARGNGRPSPVETLSFRTSDFSDFTQLVGEFLQRTNTDARHVDRACFGVAGPVKDGRARLTNLPLVVDAAAICGRFAFARTDVLNDLVTLAWSVAVLERSETAVLWDGEPDPDGGAALLAAGTGLGVALLPKVAGAFLPMPSEGGHADFAARTASDAILHAALVREFGRADVEHVLSGPGLVNIHRFVHPHTCEALARDVDPKELPAVISGAALGGRCESCRRTLEMFVSAYGAAAGNLALTSLATAGLFIGGGIAPHILAALKWPVFLESFWSKAPMESLMRRIPVTVILNPGAGLVGAANYANQPA
jgi:glucokinase